MYAIRSYYGKTIDAAPGTELFQLQPKRIAGQHRFAEFGFVDTDEIGDLVFSDLTGHQGKQAADLGHGFDDEDSRHDRVPGEMALKKRLVDSDIV